MAQAAELLTFASSQTSAISVGTSGDVLLQANYYDAITLTASDICGSGNSASRSAYANLNPQIHDVDLGATSGPTYGIKSVGATFNVPVRVQGHNSRDVTAFQIVITFDSTKLRVDSDAMCTPQAGDLRPQSPRASRREAACTPPSPA